MGNFVAYLNGIDLEFLQFVVLWSPEAGRCIPKVTEGGLFSGPGSLLKECLAVLGRRCWMRVCWY